VTSDDPQLSGSQPAGPEIPDDLGIALEKVVQAGAPEPVGGLFAVQNPLDQTGLVLEREEEHRLSAPAHEAPGRGHDPGQRGPPAVTLADGLDRQALPFRRQRGGKEPEGMKHQADAQETSFETRSVTP